MRSHVKTNVSHSHPNGDRVAMKLEDLDILDFNEPDQCIGARNGDWKIQYRWDNHSYNKERDPNKVSITISVDGGQFHLNIKVGVDQFMKMTDKHVELVEKKLLKELRKQKKEYFADLKVFLAARIEQMEKYVVQELNL